MTHPKVLGFTCKFPGFAPAVLSLLRWLQSSPISCAVDHLGGTTSSQLPLYEPLPFPSPSLDAAVAHPNCSLLVVGVHWCKRGFRTRFLFKPSSPLDIIQFRSLLPSGSTRAGGSGHGAARLEYLKACLLHKHSGHPDPVLSHP